MNVGYVKYSLLEIVVIIDHLETYAVFIYWCC